jgi:uncharacterized protein YukJ
MIISKKDETSKSEAEKQLKKRAKNLRYTFDSPSNENISQFVDDQTCLYRLYINEKHAESNEKLLFMHSKEAFFES